jgi:hypothetical protein
MDLLQQVPTVAWLLFAATIISAVVGAARRAARRPAVVAGLAERREQRAAGEGTSTR